MSPILSWSPGALNTIFIPAFRPSLQWLLLSTSPCLLFQCKSIRLAMASRLLLKCRFLSVKGGYWELWIGKILRSCPRSSRRNAVHNCRSHLQGKAHQAAQTPLRVCTMTPWHHESCMICLTKPRPVMSADSRASLCWLAATMSSLSKDSQTFRRKIHLGMWSPCVMFTSLWFLEFNIVLFCVFFYIKATTRLFRNYTFNKYSPPTSPHISNTKKERQWFWSLLGALQDLGPSLTSGHKDMNQFKVIKWYIFSLLVCWVKWL